MKRIWPALLLLLALPLAACGDKTKLTTGDLDLLCSAAREASAKTDAKAGGEATQMIGIVMDKGPSRGFMAMVNGDLITRGDKGKVIAEWRARSGLDEYDCPALERIYPGATSQPLSK